MRISDWSSDVCSSDLSTITPHTIMPTPKHALSYVRACGRTEKNRRMRPIGWPKKWRPEKGDSSIGRILENTAWLLGGKGVGALLSCVYLAIITRTLGHAGFGNFSLILNQAQGNRIFGHW